jgi:hypothetical protein
VFLYAFDLIELNGDDLRRDPLEVRRATLANVLAKVGPGIRFNEHIEGDRPTVFARTISEACDYMTDMGRKREPRQHWQRACQLILALMCSPLAGRLSLHCARVPLRSP